MQCGRHRGSRTRRRKCSKHPPQPPKRRVTACSGRGKPRVRTFVRFCNAHGDPRDSLYDRGTAWIAHGSDPEVPFRFLFLAGKLDPMPVPGTPAETGGTHLPKIATTQDAETADQIEAR
jgi:hypothetical protein